MKDLEDIIIDCQLSLEEITKKYNTDFNQIVEQEKDWLKNLEEKTSLLSENSRIEIEYVITKLKDVDYTFKETDTEKLSKFISQINSIVGIANRINNFKEGTILNNKQSLQLFKLFNKIKSTNRFSEFQYTLNNNLNSFIVHLFSVVKHCQLPEKYPIYYRFWKNILGEVLKKADDYDSFCEFYLTIHSPKHLNFAGYFGTIGTILARKISEKQVIKEEGDNNYNYIRSKILNIHYFDIITGYKRKPNYYLLDSKYGVNNDIDVFPKMLESNIVSVGFASHLDLSDFYLTDDAEMVEYLKEENEEVNSCNALRLFMNIRAGDKVAIKTNGSSKGKKGILSIVGIFEVIQNEDGEVYSYDPDGLGHTLSVKVVDAPIYEEFELGRYNSTVHKLSKQEHISQIFNRINKNRSLLLETKEKFQNTNFENLSLNTILYGPPGTGKTHLLKNKFIEMFTSPPNGIGEKKERFEFLTFHQSYSYEDFIEGIKPELSGSDVSYKIEEGIFQKMCTRARNDSSNDYAIFIDEINRGNISSIFGELITLIEDDKREGRPNEIKATLPYSKKKFSVPKNLYIIGTMNTADRSVEALDTALRRRFSFIEMNPEPEKLNTDEFKCTGIDLEALLNTMNARIEKLLDKDYCIGHSYFMTIKNRQEPIEEIKSIFQNKILPLLQEYFYGDWGKILLVIGEKFVETKKNTVKFLSTDSYEDFKEYEEKPIYNFTSKSSWTLDYFKSIYE